jgi:hypothetical protein
MHQPQRGTMRRPSRRRATSLAVAFLAIATMVGGNLALAAPGLASAGRTPGVLMAPQRWSHSSSDLHTA